MPRRTRQKTSDDIDRTDWARLRAMSDEEIERNAAEDPDNPEWTDEELAKAERVPARSSKSAIYIRLDPEVLEYFREGGRGYQSRINAVLRSYVERRRAG
jgi:uncharacterized protein (DUF4415 family)